MAFDYDKQVFTEDQEFFLSSLNVEGNHLKKKMYKQAFTFVNKSGFEEGEAWDKIEQASRGGANRIAVAKFLKQRDEMMGGNEGYNPNTDPIFPAEPNASTLPPDPIMFADIKRQEKQKQQKQGIPKSVDELKTTSFMGAVVLSDTENEEEMSQPLEKVMAEVAEQGDEGLRTAIREEDINADTQKIMKDVDAGIADTDMLQNSVNLIMQKREEKDKYMLEKKFFDKITQFKETNPAWAELRVVQPTMMEKLTDRAKKDAVIRAHLQRKISSETGTGWLRAVGEFVDDLGEFALLAIGDEAIAAARTRGTDASTLLYMGEEIRNLPIEKIPAALDTYYNYLSTNSSLLGVNQDFALRNLEDSFGTNDNIHDSQSAFLMDAVLTVPFVSAFKGLSAVLKKVGSIATVAKSAEKSIVTADATQALHRSVDDAVRDVVPFSVNGSTSSVSEAVSTSLRANEVALQELKELPNVARLTDAEASAAVRARVGQIKKLHNKEEISAVNIRYEDTKGVYAFDVLIGKRDGAGFSSQARAKAELTKRNLVGDIVETENGYFIKQVQAVSETMMDEGFTSFKPVGPVKRLLQAPKAYIDTLLGRQGTSASLVEARSIGILKEIYQKNIGSLKSSDFEEVSTLINQGLVRDDRAWMTPEQFLIEGRLRFNKEMTEAQQTAYLTYRQLSDVSHFLENGKAYKEKVIKGMHTLEVDGIKLGKFDGTIHTDVNSVIDIPVGSRVYDVGSKTFSKMSKEEVRSKLESGYVLVRPEDPSWTISELGEGASFLLVKTSKGMKVSPLEYEQLRYVAGGRREYTAPFFIGQLKRGTFSDGTKYLDNPNILRTANTVEEATKWIENAELARAGIQSVGKGSRTLQEVSDDLLKRTGKSFSEWKEIADEDEWNLAEKFLFKRDREEFPISLEDLELRDAVRMYHPDSISSQFGVRKTGRTSSRGDHLKNVNEEAAEIFDSMSALTRNVDAAIKSGVFSDFKSSAINRFNTSFRAYMKEAGSMSPYELVTKGTVDDAVRRSHPEVYNAIKAHQFYIKSILRVRGRWDEAVQHGMDRLANSIEKIPLNAAKKISTSIYKNRNNPMETIRSINFDANLGLLNPKQFLMQANSVLVSMALSPKHGLSAFGDSIPLRYALIAGDENSAKYLTKKTAGITGGTDISQAADQFRRIGFNDFGNNLAMMDAQSSLGASSNRMTNKIARAREASRIFFAEGERASRIVAYGIARRKFKDAHPDLNEFGKKADLWIREETDRLLLSPNSDNNALLNKGLGAIPTQFWSYMMKMSDALITGSGGRYTGAERMRLAGAQVMLYGAAGMPFLDSMLESYEKSTGTPMNPTLAKGLHNGIIDLIPYVASGGEINTDFSATSGLGGWMHSMVENIIENPVPELLGGPAGSNLHGAWKTMNNAAMVTGAITNPSPENVTMTALAGIGSLVKSLSSASQAYIAYNTGIWYDKYGRAVAKVSKGEALMSIGGFKPQAESDVWKILTDSKNARARFVSEVIPVFQQLHTMYNQAETEQERAHIKDRINALSTMSQGSGYLLDVSSGVLNYMRNPIFLQSLQQRLEADIAAGKAGLNPQLQSKETIDKNRAFQGNQ